MARRLARSHRPLLAALAVFLAAGPALADDAGQIKVSKGTVHIERGGQSLPAPVGARVQVADVVVTGADGSVGILFQDASLLSAGPNSVLAIDRFSFDSTTNQGAFDTSLRTGTLAAVSGKIAKQTPDAMKVRTPAAILGVRGTEFAVRTSGPAN
ncbi:MAG TPA: FecR domain-containing protein [Candidatus Methylomirabilis sp.]|nr:FecR domain-containing protein [Candidatus Methylomirabilis sp.]